MGVFQGGKMKNVLSVTAVAFVYMLFTLSSCSVQDDKQAKPAAPAAPAPVTKAEKAPPAEKKVAEKTEKAPDEKAGEKAKATKVSGDVGLLDIEKNYMIVVTKEGKLITLDFDNKTKVTEIQPTPAKIADVGLGSSAVVLYTKEGEKNVATSLEYKPAKGGD
jgi:cytoskeletal protein RodZ